MLINNNKPQTLVDYAASKGLVLLRDDLKFIRSRLQNVPKEQRIAILRRYVDEWCLGIIECENAVKKMNFGRFKANTYLREETNATGCRSLV